MVISYRKRFLRHKNSENLNTTAFIPLRPPAILNRVVVMEKTVILKDILFILGF